MDKGYNRKIKVRRKGVKLISTNMLLRAVADLQYVVNHHSELGNEMEEKIQIIVKGINNNGDRFNALLVYMENEGIIR